MRKEIKQRDKKSVFSDLPVKIQKKVIESATRAANRDQRELVERYTKTFEEAGVSCDSN